MDMAKGGKIWLSLNCLWKFQIETSKIVETHQDNDYSANKDGILGNKF